MAIISNGTTVASGGTVRGSATNLTSIPAPSSANVGSATASLSLGAVGTYAQIQYPNNSVTVNAGNTSSASNLYYSSGTGYNQDTRPSGTWRVMGQKNTGGTDSFISVWLRIS